VVVNAGTVPVVAAVVRAALVAAATYFASG
jgi:hypothetical protein